MAAPVATIMMLGASGLIGEAVANLLASEGFAVTPVARSFTAAQCTAFAGVAVETAIVDLEAETLARLMGEPIEQRGYHFGVTEDGGPFTEGQVRGDDDVGALIEAADQVKSNWPPARAKGR